MGRGTEGQGRQRDRDGQRDRGWEVKPKAPGNNRGALDQWKLKGRYLVM